VKGDRFQMTAQKREILEQIECFYLDHGYQPNVRELGALVGLSSSSTIHNHLNNLRQMGKVDWVDGQVRTLHVTDTQNERIAA
jgi:SOS-response transcriptional repressor LexA